MAVTALETNWWTKLPQTESVRVILRAQAESPDEVSSVTRTIVEQISLLPNFDEVLTQVNPTELNGLVGASLTPEQIEILYNSGLISAVIQNTDRN